MQSRWSRISAAMAVRTFAFDLAEDLFDALLLFARDGGEADGLLAAPLVGALAKAGPPGSPAASGAQRARAEDLAGTTPGIGCRLDT